MVLQHRSGEAVGVALRTELYEGAHRVDDLLYLIGLDRVHGRRGAGAGLHGGGLLLAQLADLRTCHRHLCLARLGIGFLHLGGWHGRGLLEPRGFVFRDANGLEGHGRIVRL